MRPPAGSKADRLGVKDVAGANEAASAPADDGQTADEVDRSVRDSRPYPAVPVVP